MTLVFDSSAVVALLIDPGPRGAWAKELMDSDDVAAPAFLHVEVANVLRSAAFAGRISQENASDAHDQLLSLPFDLFEYALLSSRIWPLRFNVTPYDAWYVALAEHLAAPLATLDGPLLRAPGPRCEFLTYHP